MFNLINVLISFCSYTKDFFYTPAWFVYYVLNNRVSILWRGGQKENIDNC